MHLGNDLWNITPKAQATKAKLTKEDCVRLKCFCPAKENNKLKRQHMEWEKVFASYISGKRLISKIYETLIQLGSKNKHKIKYLQLKNQQRTYIDIFLK